MANELAAMATMPSGATITVVIICAPQMAICSNPIGREMRTAWRSVSFQGRKLPCPPDSLSMDERRQRYHIIPPAVISSANTVPNTAPSTPKPTPGTSELPSPPVYLPCRENKEEVEHDIPKTHQYIKHTGYTHIPTTPQHAARKEIQL
mgnify:CR=1 FL=1